MPKHSPVSYTIAPVSRPEKLKRVHARRLTRWHEGKIPELDNVKEGETPTDRDQEDENGHGGSTHEIWMKRVHQQNHLPSRQQVTRKSRRTSTNGSTLPTETQITDLQKTNLRKTDLSLIFITSCTLHLHHALVGPRLRTIVS